MIGHVQRMSDTRTVKKIINCNPLNKRSQGKPKNRWEDKNTQDICQIKVKNWIICVQDRRKWKEVVEKAESFNYEVQGPEEEEEDKEGEEEEEDKTKKNKKKNKKKLMMMIMMKKKKKKEKEEEKEAEKEKTKKKKRKKKLKDKKTKKKKR